MTLTTQSSAKRSFHRIQASMHKLYGDPATPKEVRRRIVEGSVRAPQEWHAEAVRKAYADGDPEWKQTAVFSMGYVPGFNAQILESLNSQKIPKFICRPWWLPVTSRSMRQTAHPETGAVEQDREGTAADRD